MTNPHRDAASIVEGLLTWVTYTRGSYFPKLQTPFPSPTLYSVARLYSICTMWDTNVASIFIDGGPTLRIRRIRATSSDPNSRQLCARRIALMERHRSFSSFVITAILFHERANPYICVFTWKSFHRILHIAVPFLINAWLYNFKGLNHSRILNFLICTLQSV